MNLKKYVLVLLLLVPVIQGCNKELKEEAAQLRKDNDQLKTTVAERDKTISGLKAQIQNIDKDLEAVISEKEALEEIRAEGNFGRRVKLYTVKINDILKENEKRVNSLRWQLGSTRKEVGKLQEKVNGLHAQLTMKNDTIAMLRERIGEQVNKISQLTENVKILQEENRKQTEMITEMQDKMNTAYFVKGSSTELIEDNVVHKVGGFLGFLGRTEMVQPDFNHNPFTKVDIREKKSIEINAGKVTFVTTHPSGSYKLERAEGEISNLVITDPDKFWEASKYLVIITK